MRLEISAPLLGSLNGKHHNHQYFYRGSGRKHWSTATLPASLAARAQPTRWRAEGARAQGAVPGADQPPALPALGELQAALRRRRADARAGDHANPALRPCRSRPLSAAVLAQRSLSTGLYFPLEDLFSTLLRRSGAPDLPPALRQSLAGQAAGAANGVLLNPLACAPSASTPPAAPGRVLSPAAPFLVPLFCALQQRRAPPPCCC